MNRRRCLPLALLVVVALLLASGLSHAAHYPEPVPTTEVMTLTASVTVNGGALSAGDEVAVYSVHPQPAAAGKWERTVIGRHVVVAGEQTVTLFLYGDDNTTSGVVEGAVPGEEVGLLLWRASEGMEYAAYRAPAGGPVSVTWSPGVVPGLAEVDFTSGERIPLRNGAWNLFSYGVLQGYRASGKPFPSSPQLPGVAWDNVATPGEAFPLRSIAGKYDRVLGNDGTGATFWNPLLPSISTLSYLAPGYGYWVKMKPSPFALSWLTVPGPRTAGSESLPLNAGWTLTGYWGRPVFHAGSYFPWDGLFPVDVYDNVALSSIGDLWSSLGLDYVRVTSFDGAGAHLWNPSLPQTRTLNYMGPGYGYWVKMSRPGTLSYPGVSVPPTAATLPASGIGTDTAVLNGSVTPNGMVTDSWFEYGPNPDLSNPNLTAAQPVGNGIAGVSVSHPVSGLSAGTTYYFRIVASNPAGATRGSIAEYVTGSPGSPPAVQTFPASGVTSDNATLSGSVIPNGQATQAWFEWGTDGTLSTFSSTTAQSVGAGSTSLVLGASLAGLSPGTTYSYRVAASNAAGNSRGSISRFTTTAPYIPPSVATLGATDIGSDTATINGSVNPNGLAATAYFEWGTDSQLAAPNFTTVVSVGSGNVAVPVNTALAGLAAGSTYYYRLVGMNPAGMAFGQAGSFTTSPPVPRNVSAAARAGSITVSWSPVSGATSYNVYWSASPNVTKLNGTKAGSVATPYVQTGLARGTTRYYVVTCVVAGAEGPESAEANATIPVSLVAGPDVGQYFDRGFQAPGPQNYDDRSSHPLRGLTTPADTLLFGGVNCLDCHYVSGPARTSDECLKCHFENQPNAPAGNHGDGALQLSAVSGNNLPTAQYAIGTIQDYDAWCLQCHQGEATSLGGTFPSAARRTVVDPAAFANSRHRQPNQVGCVYCHQPHGRSNTKLVRENPDVRRSALAGPLPALFGVFPNDALNGTSYGPPQNIPYRARPHWGDNALPNLPEAGDDQAYCNKACHVAKYSGNYAKDKMILREEGTGNYITGPAPMYLKVYLVNGLQYTIDNLPMLANRHGHVNGEIIPTYDMVWDYASLIGLTGPTYYYYPLPWASSNPSTYDPSLSALPFRPDLPDGSRDFPDAWNGLGVRIAYRFTCSTCHDPHGTTMPNSPGSSGYPDLRLPRTNPDTLCHQCH